jgi:predicted transposase YdaD
MSREDVEAMFTLSDLKQTRVYQAALQEAEELAEVVLDFEKVADLGVWLKAR